jgi:hypothetical protein
MAGAALGNVTAHISTNQELATLALSNFGIPLSGSLSAGFAVTKIMALKLQRMKYKDCFRNFIGLTPKMPLQKDKNSLLLDYQYQEEL